MGLTYSRMTFSTIVGDSTAVDRTAEAAHYLKLSLNWDDLKTLDVYQNVDSVLFSGLEEAKG